MTYLSRQDSGNAAPLCHFCPSKVHLRFVQAADYCLNVLGMGKYADRRLLKSEGEVHTKRFRAAFGSRSGKTARFREGSPTFVFSRRSVQLSDEADFTLNMKPRRTKYRY